MHIWVDTDACPLVIKEILYRAAEPSQIPIKAFGDDERGVQGICRKNTVLATCSLDVSPRATYLKALVAAGVLEERAIGKEKLFVHPKLMNLLTRDGNSVTAYR